MKKTIPCEVAANRRKYLEINVANLLSDMDTDRKLQNIVQGVTGGLRAWKGARGSQIGRLSLVTIPVLPKLTYSSTQGL